MDPTGANKFKPIKMVVIGDGGVGKTSLIKWYFPINLIILVISMINSPKSTCLLSSIVIEQKFQLIIDRSLYKYGTPQDKMIIAD